jgi:hypothetical protein
MTVTEGLAVVGNDGEIIRDVAASSLMNRLGKPESSELPFA